MSNPKHKKPWRSSPQETSTLLHKELRRRGMSDIEIEAATRKKKRRKILEFNTVKSQHLIDHPALREKPRRKRATAFHGEDRNRLKDELCTVHFAAEQLNLHRKTILRFIREGRLPAKRIGKSYRILRSDLEKLSGLPARGAMPSTPGPSVTSIVDVPQVGAELAKKWSSTITSALQSRPKAAGAVRADVIYEPERTHLKIIVVGAPSDAVHLLSLIHVWMEQLRV